MSSIIQIRIFRRALSARLSSPPGLRYLSSLPIAYKDVDARSQIQNCTKDSANQFYSLRQARRYASKRSRTPHPYFVILQKTSKESPILFPISVLGILAGLGALIYTVYYLNLQRTSLSLFPEPVAKHLRRALYYTTQSPNPKRALQEYQKAILVADDINLDPFSPEMLGVKIQVADFFAKLGGFQNAIGILEQVRADCLTWNEYYGDKPEHPERRARLLATAVRLSVKLGEYYVHPTIAQPEVAEEKMAWAVTAILKEQQRREAAGLETGDTKEGGWISEDESGGALEALADYYTTKSRHYLSAPLYLQALSFSPPRSCHAVVLMNNLAIALALQNPPSIPNPTQLNSTTSMTAQLSSAKTWANKALTLAGSIEPPERNEECDQACAVAMMNLGDFAQLGGDSEEAKRWWEEGQRMSKTVGFAEGEKEAGRKLDRLALLEKA